MTHGELDTTVNHTNDEANISELWSLRWLEHLSGASETNPSKKLIFTWVEGIKGVGRHQRNRLDIVELELSKLETGRKCRW
jgi:hypothetical protein